MKRAHDPNEFTILGEIRDGTNYMAEVWLSCHLVTVPAGLTFPSANITGSATLYTADTAGHGDGARAAFNRYFTQWLGDLQARAEISNLIAAPV